MIWFTADFHLSHKKIIDYCNRPFKNIEEMDAILVNNLKSKLKSKDTLYFLGDLSFKKSAAEFLFEELKDIEIHFIIGNHDSKVVIKLAKEFCSSVSKLKNINCNNQSITLCHYAMRVWNKSHFNAWNLFAHSHGKLAPIGKQYDVGIDNNNFMPISFEQLVVIMEKQPNNFNFISQRL